MIMVLTFVQKEIAMDASLLRKWIVWFIGAFFLVYVVGCASLQDARPSPAVASHGACKGGDGTARSPSIAKPPGRPLHTNRASVSWALNEASFRSFDAPRHGFVFEGMT